MMFKFSRALYFISTLVLFVFVVPVFLPLDAKKVGSKKVRVEPSKNNKDSQGGSGSNSDKNKAEKRTQNSTTVKLTGGGDNGSRQKQNSTRSQKSTFRQKRQKTQNQQQNVQKLRKQQANR